MHFCVDKNKSKTIHQYQIILQDQQDIFDVTFVQNKDCQF